MNEKSTVAVLEALHKNVTMGKQSLMEIMQKVEHDKLKAELTKQLNEYAELCEEIAELLKVHGVEAKAESLINKISAKMSTTMNTLTDSTSEHIAQLVIEGTTMGITDTIRLIRENENGGCSEDALTLAKEIASAQEKMVERTKKYL